MACSKYNLTNTGSTIVNFSYRRCDDSMWDYQVELLPNQSKNIWLIDDTYTVAPAFKSVITLVDDGAFPPIDVTNTPTPSNSPTPTNSPTPSVTATQTPTNTQTPTPTETLSETVAETPTPTPTQTPWDYCYSFNGGFNQQAEAAFEDNLGRIVFGGLFTSYSGIPFNRIVRINSDASVDDTFNIGTGFDGAVYDVEPQSDNKILVGGFFGSYSGVSFGKIVRLNVDGSIDYTFSVGTGFDNVVWVIRVQSDGKILVGGGYTQYNGNSHPHLIRLNSDGSVDNTFDLGTGLNGDVYEIILQNDGKIIILGDFTSVDGNTHNRIVRLNDDGSIDNTFNSGTGFNGTVYSGLIDEGQIVAVGGFFEYSGQTNRQIVKLNSDGSIDDTFDSGAGFTRFSGLSFSTTIIKYTDKYFVLGDFDTYNGGTANGLIQLNQDGSINVSFNYGTGLVFSSGTFNTGIILNNGVHVVFGEFSQYKGSEVNDIAFINPFGTLLNCPYPTPTPTTTPTPTVTPT
jgi:uncharacterized delta-60 repeat protein